MLKEISQGVIYIFEEWDLLKQNQTNREKSQEENSELTSKVTEMKNSKHWMNSRDKGIKQKIHELEFF